MRFPLAVLVTVLLSSASFAQEESLGDSRYEEGAAWTSSTSRAEDSCGADTKLDLQRWKDFAEALSPVKPRRFIAH